MQQNTAECFETESIELYIQRASLSRGLIWLLAHLLPEEPNHTTARRLGSLLNHLILPVLKHGSVGELADEAEMDRILGWECKFMSSRPTLLNLHISCPFFKCNMICGTLFLAWPLILKTRKFSEIFLRGPRFFFYLRIYLSAAKGNFDSTTFPLQRWVFQPCTYILFKYSTSAMTFFLHVSRIFYLLRKSALKKHLEVKKSLFCALNLSLKIPHYTVCV